MSTPGQRVLDVFEQRDELLELLAEARPYVYEDGVFITRAIDLWADAKHPREDLCERIDAALRGEC